MTDLALQAAIRVDNSGAVGPLKVTDKAVQDLQARLNQTGQAARVATPALKGTSAAAAEMTPAMTRASGASAQLRVSIDAQTAASRQNTAAVLAMNGQLQALQARLAATGAASSAAAANLGNLGRAATVAGGAMGAGAGVAARLGSALGGPLGLAIGAVVLGLINLAGAARDASDAKDDLIAVGNRLDALTGRLKKTLEEQVAQESAATFETIRRTIALREQTIAQLQNLEAQERALKLSQQAGGRGDPGAGSLGVGLALNAGQQQNVQAEIAAQEKAIATANAQLAAGAKKLGTIAAEARAKEARAAESAAGRAQAASERLGRAASAAAREAAAAQREHNREVEGLAKAARQAASFDLFRPGMVADQFNAQQRARETDDLAGLVKQAEDRLPQAGEQAGQDLADRANAELLRNAGALGQMIGGSTGRQFASSAAALLSGDNALLSEAPGVGGVVARTLAPGFQSKEFREAFRPLVAQFKMVFGDRELSKQLGEVFQGAQVGASLGGNSREGQVGGAIGGALGKVAGDAIGKAVGGTLGKFAGPLGSIVGGLLGSALGSLFSKPKTGSVTLSGSGGNINQGAAVGTGGSQRANATSLGGSVGSTLQQVIDRLGGEVGRFSVSIGQDGKNFRVDTSGQGRTNKKRSGVLAFGEDEGAAVQAALADAIRDGAVAGVSPRVQTALQRYAEDLNKAVAEALKVQDLERLLANRANPFAGAFQDFERQARERLKVARNYGFDVLEIERVNAEERGKLLREQLEGTTASIRQLLDDLRFGSRSEGSIVDRLGALGTERSRLQGLIDGGDTSQIDALAQVVQQQLDLSKQAFGTTGQFASDRAGAIADLQALVTATEARINAAQSAAESQTANQLAELNTTADEQTEIQQRILAALQQMGGGSGGGSGFDPGIFARTLV